MSYKMFSGRALTMLVGTAAIAFAAIAGTGAVAAQAPQAPAGGRAGGPPATPQSTAAVDLVGNWVAVVNEDWRWRMVTPPKGDFASVPLNPAGTTQANTWTPAMDGQCEAYGAAGLMRQPTRVRISWQDPQTLKIETDAGTQTRLLNFDPSAAKPTARSLQGFTTAEWERPGGAGRGVAGLRSDGPVQHAGVRARSAEGRAALKGRGA